MPEKRQVRGRLVERVPRTNKALRCVTPRTIAFENSRAFLVVLHSLTCAVEHLPALLSLQRQHARKMPILTRFPQSYGSATNCFRADDAERGGYCYYATNTSLP